MTMGVRRVVTGHSPEGKAIFASDEEVEPVVLDLVPGFEFGRIWGGDEAPTYPDDGSALPGHTYFPPLGGFRFGTFTVPPESAVGSVPDDLDFEAALEAMATQLPGMADHMEPDAPGMHTTDTIDFGYVASGEVVLELDDGAEMTLRAGDTYVQSGTRHRWTNRGDVPCTLVVCLVGARRS
jgi:mannose-6-phosphate isomerase-like protein (cupin superfamily)